MATRKLLFVNTASGFSFFDSALSGSDSVTFGGAKLTNVANGVDSTDAINKGQLDAYAVGLSWKSQVRLATAAALPACTYDNGTLGVGATLTADANGALTVDGKSPSVADRVLVKNQVAAEHNGIYTVTAVGDAENEFVLTRATDFDVAAEIAEGDALLVTDGDTNINCGFVLGDTGGAVTVGTTDLNFVQFTGAGLITAGNGISKVGNTLSVKVKSTGGVAVDGDGVAVKIKSTGGLATDGDGSAIKLKANSGVTTDGDGLQVVLNGSTLACGASGLSVSSAPVLDVTLKADVAISAYQAVYYSANGEVSPGDCSNSAKCGIIGLAAAGISEDANGVIRQQGVVTGALTGATAGTPYFLGTGGLPVVIGSVGEGNRVIQLGVAKNATDLDVNIQVGGYTYTA